MTFTPQAADETGASQARRKREGYFPKYFPEGSRVLDIGCGHKPVVPWADTWDIALGDGDAKAVAAPDGVFTTVYASHVLEHMPAPQDALHEWWRLVSPGGHLIVAVPDEDLYEQGLWPSLFNADHRYTYTSLKGPHSSTGPNTLQLADLLATLPYARLISLRICDEGYVYNQKPRDQSGAERQVEAIVQKVPKAKEWHDTLAGRFQCPCGSYEHLRLRGIQANGRLLTECRKCGQHSSIMYDPSQLKKETPDAE